MKNCNCNLFGLHPPSCCRLLSHTCQEKTKTKFLFIFTIKSNIVFFQSNYMSSETTSLFTGQISVNRLLCFRCYAFTNHTDFNSKRGELKVWFEQCHDNVRRRGAADGGGRLRGLRVTRRKHVHCSLRFWRASGVNFPDWYFLCETYALCWRWLWPLRACVCVRACEWQLLFISSQSTRRASLCGHCRVSSCPPLSSAAPS